MSTTTLTRFLVMKHSNNYDDVHVWGLWTAVMKVRTVKVVGEDGTAAKRFKYGPVQLLREMSIIFTGRLKFNFLSK